MTTTLELPSETAVGLELIAAKNGVSVHEYLQQLVAQARQRDQFVVPSAEEFNRILDGIAERYVADGLPTLSDEAISRESIYADRGL